MQEIFQNEGCGEISRLYMGKNPKLNYKAGIFLGDGIKSNPNHPIEKLSFKCIRLGDDGLLRILEALNANENIKVAHLGVIGDQGLLMLAKKLADNKSLLKLKF